MLTIYTVHFIVSPSTEVSLHSKPASAWNLDYIGTLPRNTSEKKQIKLRRVGLPTDEVSILRNGMHWTDTVEKFTDP